jgi:hypothetical protein
MNLSYKLKRGVVKFRKSMERKRRNYAMNMMNDDQKKIFDLVVHIAETYNDAIRFDPYDHKILIPVKIGEEVEIMITMVNETVYIDNHKGFRPEQFRPEVYELLVEKIEKEAHKDRRKMELEIAKRKKAFINSISEMLIQK